MNNKISKLLENKKLYLYTCIFIFIICFLIMAGQDFRLTEGNDDVVYTQSVKQYGSAYNFMVLTYNNWNPRYFTNLSMSFVMDKNIYLWRVLNSIILFGLIFYLSKIINILYNIIIIPRKTIILLATFATVALIPASIVTQSITWVTGSFNYLWPASALIISFYYLFNSTFNKEKIKIYQFILLIPIVLFAANTEQTSLICITMYSIVLFYYFLKYKYVDKYLLVLYLFIIVSTFAILFAPALPKRYIMETKVWYPIFNQLSIYVKALQGYVWTVLHAFLLHAYTNTITLSALLFIIIKKQYNNKIYNILCLLPLFYALFYYTLGRHKLPFISNLHLYNLQSFSTSYLNNNLNEPFFSVIIATFLLLIIIFFIFKIKWSSFERKYLSILFLFSGICSSFIVSFSPTIYASGPRIFFIPFIMYILLILMVFVESLKYINIKSKKVIIIFIAYILLAFIDIFSKVYK